MDILKGARLQVISDDGMTVESAPRVLRARAASMNIERLADRRRSRIDDILAHAAIHGESLTVPASAWTVDSIAGPNVSDHETVLSFARMSANAYVPERGTGDWNEVGTGFNYTDDFGWEADGLRGHIFADETNGTIVIGLKGTSPAVFDGSDTTGNDKLNDNLFGSCCCGQGGQYLWKQVCDCMTSTYTCNNTCLVKSLREKSHYYWAVRDLYHNVTERYPNSDVWITGHSLGGVVSSLLGLTYGLPTVTFEAYPDALAASRLGLPVPPGYRIGSHHSRANLGIYHFGHTADPIYMGSCNAASSFCTLAGYAFQGLCHTGQTCVFDTVGDFGWRVGIGTHKISNVIRDVLMKYETMPKCETDVECQDCFNWKFFKSNGSETTTSSKRTSTSTRASTSTRTETCKTPGWWGCLDESKTATATTTSTTSTSSSSTSTCKTPGWFGCNDPTTTTSSTKASTPSAAPVPTVTSSPATSTSSVTRTTTCETPGWFGCNDPTSMSARPSSTATHSTPTATRTTTSRCTSKEWFGLICVDPSPTTPQPPRSGQTKIPQSPRKCAHRSWYGACKEWTRGAKVDL